MSKVLTLLAAAMLFCGPARAAVPFEEEQALRQIYTELDGENWHDSTRWLNGDPCTWKGVECFDGHVSKIQLPENRLRGDFGRLDKFEFLDHLGQLELWNTLDTAPDRRNILTGRLPPRFATLTALYYVDLRFNQIADGLEAFVPLTGLQTLALEENEFFGPIPSDFGNLRALTLLTLNGNRIHGEIPSRLGELTGLTKLWLYNNELDSEIPPSLGSLSNLTELRLGGNLLHGSIPASLGSLTKLTTLELGLAKLSGSLPTTLDDLRSLEILSLGTNRLSGELGEISWERMGALRQVYLDRNMFSGELPTSLAALSLTTLRLRSNGIDGVPEGYAALAARAAELDLRWNALDPSGPLTAALDAVSAGEFSATQTRVPRDVRASFVISPGPGGSSNVQLYVSWLPIPFVAGDGGYRIAVQFVRAGQSFDVAPTFVAGKEKASALVVFANPVATPSLTDTVLVRVSAVSEPHPFNDGRVESKQSALVAATIGTGEGAAVFERERIAVREGDTLQLGVLRVQGNTGMLRSNVSATTGSASWSDFSQPKPPRLGWQAGEAAPKPIKLSTVADNRREGIETFALKVDSPAASDSAVVEVGDQTVAGDASDPLIATNSEGLSFAVWTEPQQRSALHDVRGRFLDTGGRPSGAVIEVAVDALLDEHDPVIVALEDESFLVGWIEEPGDGSDKRIGMCRMRAREKRCSRYVEPLNAPSANGLTLTALGGGAWVGWTTGALYLASPISASGEVGTRITVAAAEAGRRLSEPQLVAVDEDALAAAWTSTLTIATGAEPRDGGEIQSRALPLGAPLPPVHRVGDPTSLARMPRLVRVDADTALLAWLQVDKDRRRGKAEVAWTEVEITTGPMPSPRQVEVAGDAVVQLALVRETNRCQLVWIAATAGSEQLERWVLPGCRAQGAVAGPTLHLNRAEGNRESLAATASRAGLIVVEQLVAVRGVRWLRNLPLPVP